MKLGFNLSGLPLGLSPLGFHISHGGKKKQSEIQFEKRFFPLFFSAAFALMFVYWKYLNMFETIRYLALISIPLFIFGHRLLATLAERR